MVEKGGNEAPPPHLVEAVSTEQDNLHQALANIATQTVSTQVVEADPATAQAVLDRLEVLLTTGDTEFKTLFLESEALLKSTFGPVVEQLGQQIEAFDYPAALTTLKSMRPVP